MSRCDTFTCVALQHKQYVHRETVHLKNKFASKSTFLWAEAWKGLLEISWRSALRTAKHSMVENGGLYFVRLHIWLCATSAAGPLHSINKSPQSTSHNVNWRARSQARSFRSGQRYATGSGGHWEPCVLFTPRWGILHVLTCFSGLLTTRTHTSVHVVKYLDGKLAKAFRSSDPKVLWWKSLISCFIWAAGKSRNRPRCLSDDRAKDAINNRTPANPLISKSTLRQKRSGRRTEQSKFSQKKCSFFFLAPSQQPYRDNQQLIKVTQL